MRTACETAINHGFAVNTEEDEKVKNFNFSKTLIPIYSYLPVFRRKIRYPTIAERNDPSRIASLSA